MLEQTLSVWLPIFYLPFSVLSVSSSNSIVHVNCSQLHFTPMTPFESNINTLFTSLVDSALVSSFKNFQISPPGSSQSDNVYGLFQCRGDLSSSKCKDCVANSVSQLKKSCPISIGVNIQLEGCIVKYNNTSFFGIEDKLEVAKSCGPLIGNNSDAWNRIDDALTYLTAGNGQCFRKGTFESLQGVAQCVEDLSVSQCEDCLLEARARLRSECETSSWGNMYLAKCFIRYADQDDKDGANNDTYDCNDYYDNHDRSKNKRKMKRKRDNKQVLRWVVTIGATVAAVILTTIIVVTFLILYKKYKRDERLPATTEIKSAPTSSSSRPPLPPLLARQLPPPPSPPLLLPLPLPPPPPSQPLLLPLPLPPPPPVCPNPN